MSHQSWKILNKYYLWSILSFMRWLKVGATYWAESFFTSLLCPTILSFSLRLCILPAAKNRLFISQFGLLYFIFRSSTNLCHLFCLCRYVRLPYLFNCREHWIFRGFCWFLLCFSWAIFYWKLLKALEKREDSSRSRMMTVLVYF